MHLTPIILLLQQVPLLSLLVLLRRSWLRPDMVCCIRKHQDITDPEEQKPYGSPKYRDCSSVPTFNIWVSGTEVLEDKGSFVLYHSSWEGKHTIWLIACLCTFKLMTQYSQRITKSQKPDICKVIKLGTDYASVRSKLPSNVCKLSANTKRSARFQPGPVNLIYGC